MTNNISGEEWKGHFQKLLGGGGRKGDTSGEDRDGGRDLEGGESER